MPCRSADRAGHRFSPEPLAARHLDERLLRIFRRYLVPELASCGVRQRDHLVREVHRVIGLLGVPEGAERLAEQRLQVHLAGVDDVVDALRTAEGWRGGIAV